MKQTQSADRVLKSARILVLLAVAIVTFLLSYSVGELLASIIDLMRHVMNVRFLTHG